MSARPNDWLDEALSALLDGSADDATYTALRRRLAEDPSARRRYLDFVELHALLHWTASPDSVAGTPPVVRRRSRTVPALIAAAVAVAAALWVALWLWPSPTRDVAAEITYGIHAVWRDGAEARQRGDRLAAGDRVALAHGLCEMSFGPDVTVLVQGPAEFEIVGPAAGRLLEGRLTAFVAPGGEGFRIETPYSRVVDLGTEFGVSVDTSSEASRVQVFEGEVEVEPLGNGASEARVLREAEAVTVQAGRVLDAVSSEYSSFVRRLPWVGRSPSDRLSTAVDHTWSRDIGDGSWEEASSWTGGTVPGHDSSVRLSGWFRTATTESDAAAGDVSIGNMRWWIRRCRVEVEGLLGSVEVGVRSNAMLVVQDASLAIADRLVLRSDSRTIVVSGTVTVGTDLFFVDYHFDHGLVDSSAQGHGSTLALLRPDQAPCRVEARNLFGLGDTDVLRFGVGTVGAPRIVVRELAAIGGALEFEFDEVSGPPRSDHLLLEVLSDQPLLGSFTNREDGETVHEFEDGARLVLDLTHAASGSAENDVALVYESGR